MYYSYFGLKEAPFSIAPNPEYLFMTERHQEALAHLYHGVGSDAGFVLLTGDVGTGKTTVCRRFLNNLPEHTQIAFILNPCLDSLELLQAICQELQIQNVPHDAGFRSLTDSIYNYLLDKHANGGNTVLLIDEAQQIQKPVLEIVRLLTNLETDTQKLLKIILVGQPELNDVLAQPDLAQLSQRITARYHIKPLTIKEMSTYLDYRLRMAGYSVEKKLFSTAIVKLLFGMTQGVPRLINVICDRALLGVYAQNASVVNKRILQKAFYEVRGNYSLDPANASSAWSFTRLALLLLVGSFALWHFSPMLSSLASIESIASALIKAEPLAPEWLAVNSEPSQGAADESVLANVQPIGLLPVASPATITPLFVAPDVLELMPPTPRQYPQSSLAISALLAVIAPALSGVESRCDKLEAVGWRCGNGLAVSWRSFRKYNRPSVIALDNGSERYFISIVSMTSTHALVSADDGEVSVPLIELGEYWTGDFTYLWQPPLGFERFIYTGANANLINWLAKSFAIIDGRKQVLANKKYNNLLKKRIQLFQKKNNLKEDGKAGVETLLKLNEALGVAVTLDSTFNKSVDSSSSYNAIN
ncbi:MAG: general secretion pathway protein A [Kiritimatiellia bacterium]|jgi:general secretion pathway protein A